MQIPSCRAAANVTRARASDSVDSADLQAGSATAPDVSPATGPSVLTVQAAMTAGGVPGRVPVRASLAPVSRVRPPGRAIPPRSPVRACTGRTAPPSVSIRSTSWCSPVRAGCPHRYAQPEQRVGIRLWISAGAPSRARIHRGRDDRETPSAGLPGIRLIPPISRPFIPTAPGSRPPAAPPARTRQRPAHRGCAGRWAGVASGGVFWAG